MRIEANESLQLLNSLFWIVEMVQWSKFVYRARLVPIVTISIVLIIYIHFFFHLHYLTEYRIRTSYLVLHVGSDWEEFFYPALRPWLHYVPVEATADQAELRSLLEFVQAHDAEMSEIGARGASFVEKHLTMATVSCYWKALLLQYTSLLQFTVESDSRLIRIK